MSHDIPKTIRVVYDCQPLDVQNLFLVLKLELRTTMSTFLRPLPSLLKTNGSAKMRCAVEVSQRAGSMAGSRM